MCIRDSTYTGADRQAVYRKAAGNQDISGDYNVYDTVGETQAGGSAVTLKGNGGVYSLAVWSDEMCIRDRLLIL